MKKISLVLILFLLVAMCPSFNNLSYADEYAGSRQLKVLGNKLVYADDESVEVHLTGMNVCGSEWMGNPDSEHVKRSVKEAVYNWDANLIRLGVSLNGWWGRYSYIHDGGEFYRSYIADVIDIVRDTGKYIILDLHEYNYVSQENAQFWSEAAEMFGNNPAVLFGLLNEPCGNITWDTWRNGDGGDNFGMQPLVELIRSKGAKNILVAGGLSYSGDLRGIVDGYELIDCAPDYDTSKSGYGIMYDAHIYPAHGDTKTWDSKFGNARRDYPILIGEFGWDPEDSVVVGTDIPPESDKYHDKWFPEIFDWMNDDITYGSKANWTAWCFHPSSSPRMLEKYDRNGVSFGEEGYEYTPTEWFGSYIKQWLKDRLSENVAEGKNIIEYTDGRPSDSTLPQEALDGDKETAWICANSADKTLIVDLGAVYNINRWQVYHKNTLNSYRLEVSTDLDTWTVADSCITEISDVSDRYFKAVPARYVKLYIDDSDQISHVYEFRVEADNSGDGFIDCDYAVDNSGIELYEVSYDFYNGDEMPCWWASGNYPEYVENASEDSMGSVMRFSGASSRMMALQGFTDTAGFDYFEYKYKSDYDISVNFYLDYRASGSGKLTTNKITLPSTNGQWSIFRVTPEQLMPTPEDTWVKEDLSTGWSAAGNNFEPILISNMNTSGSGTADFEYFKAVWTMKNNFSFESIRVLQNGLETDYLKQGEADFYIRYHNGETKKLKNLLAVIAIYDSDGKLVSMTPYSFNAGINIRTAERKIKIDIPYDGCTAKIFTWRTAEDMLPVTGTVIF